MRAPERVRSAARQFEQVAWLALLVGALGAYFTWRDADPDDGTPGSAVAFAVVGVLAWLVFLAVARALDERSSESTSAPGGPGSID